MDVYVVTEVATKSESVDVGDVLVHEVFSSEEKAKEFIKRLVGEYQTWETPLIINSGDDRVIFNGCKIDLSNGREESTITLDRKTIDVTDI